MQNYSNMKPNYYVQIINVNQCVPNNKILKILI